MPEIDWAGLLHQEDVEGIWNALFRLVTRHPAVRPLRFATDEASDFEINADLAQELFLELFQKSRFDYYLANEYSSTDIENELTHIELPNLVGARLRKRYPESFRMARRVSSLLKSSAAFRPYGKGATAPVQDASKAGRKPRLLVAAVQAGASADGRPPASSTNRVSCEAAGRAQPPALQGLNAGPANAPVINAQINEDSDSFDVEDWEPSEEDRRDASGTGAQPRRQRMVNQMFGLKKWPATKPIGDSGCFSELAMSVPVRNRDTRIVGRSGSAQLILSNKELEDLIVDIFKAIDSPADVKTIRQLALSKIPLQDYSISALDAEFAGEEGRVATSSSANAAFRGTAHAPLAIDTRPSPEEELLNEEHRESLGRLAQDFLERLRRAVNNNPQRYERMIQTLWYCFYDPKEPSQIEVAEFLGISDSLVSNNRKIVEHELKKLALSLDDGMVFSELLGNLVVQQRRRGLVLATPSSRRAKLAPVGVTGHQPQPPLSAGQKTATPRRNRA